MGRFLVRRLIFAVLLVVASSSAALLLTRLAPGDVTRANSDRMRTPRARWRRCARASASIAVPWSSGRRGRAAPRASTSAIRFSTAGRSVRWSRAPALNTARARPGGAGDRDGRSASRLGIFTGSRRGGLLAGARARRRRSLCVSMPPLLTSLLLVFVAGAHRLAADRRHVVGRRDRSGVGGVAGRRGLAPAAAGAGAGAADRGDVRAAAVAVDAPRRCGSRSCWRRPARGVSPRQLILRHAWPVSLRPICGDLRRRHRRAALRLVRRRVRDRLARAGPADVRGAAGARHLPGGRVRRRRAPASWPLGTLVGDVLLALVDPRVRQGGPA